MMWCGSVFIEKNAKYGVQEISEKEMWVHTPHLEIIYCCNDHHKVFSRISTLLIFRWTQQCELALRIRSTLSNIDVTLWTAAIGSPHNTF